MSHTFAKESGPSPPGGLWDAISTLPGMCVEIVLIPQKIPDQAKMQLHLTRLGSLNMKEAETSLVAK
jgi:hypothetical protein